MRATTLQPFRAGPAPRACRIRAAVPRANAVTVCAAKTVELTSVERQALAAFNATNTEKTKEGVLRLLTRAALGRQVDAEVTEGALLALEQMVAGESTGPVPDVAGTWRLVFGTATKFRPFQWIPVKEDFIINDQTKDLSLESALGPLDFFIRGRMNAWRPESGELEFQFNKVDIHFRGEKVYEVNPKTKPKTYTFFHVGPELACARSSAGGLALMRK
ncbi:hypothetical protein HYH03_011548 [Edaphochlamys debaryana]|uniref:Plastid lipid-associated protein/fibrillin conserved domain-containing protein n=1 Tax=Edaphochlamys debaryana TaxID=47281 RepID=A0A836BUT4_9CHLO|nr:hypothetical protein HYH03_011548 [Edaphochlamys debaryana]|eukprot:KAG2489911.1 hypothetical protein HYH03_011548 [Edaphochlamys debaryana]